MSLAFERLGAVCNINPRLPKDANESQNVSFLSMSSVSEKGKILDQETRVLSETKKGFTYFERGDILLAKITPCFENGKAVLTSDLKNLIGYGSTEFHVLRPIQGIANGKYLFYIVWNDSFRLHGQHAMKGAAGQKRISADFLKNFKIPLPPLAEQQKIAAILDAADSLRQKDQQLIEKYNALSQSLFLDMFGDPVTNPMGWKKLKLSALTSFENGDKSSNYPSGSDIKSEGILFLSTKNILNNYLDLTFTQYISEDKFTSLTRGKAKEGDLLITLRGTLGNCCIFNSTCDTAFINAQIMIIRTNQQISSVYLHALITNKQFNKMLQSIGRGAAVPQLTASQLSKLKIIFPAITLQNQFAERIQLIEAQKQQAQASLQKSEALFNSLLQRAFKGELT